MNEIKEGRREWRNQTSKLGKEEGYRRLLEKMRNSMRLDTIKDHKKKKKSFQQREKVKLCKCKKYKLKHTFKNDRIK